MPCHVKKKYDDAIEKYKDALKLNPNDDVAHFMIGLCYGRKGKYDLAIQSYNRSIELDGNSPTAFGNRGYMYYRKKLYDKAIDDLNQAIDIDMMQPLPYLWLAHVYADMGLKTEANKNFAKYLRYECKNDYYLNEIGEKILLSSK